MFGSFWGGNAARKVEAFPPGALPVEPPARPIADNLVGRTGQPPPMSIPSAPMIPAPPCSFCERSTYERLVARGTVGICDECVADCNGAVTIDTQAPDGRVFADLGGI